MTNYLYYQRGRRRVIKGGGNADALVTFVNSLTGSVKYVWDTTYNGSSLVTQGAGVASNLAEYGGGPNLVLSNSPVWDSVNKRIVFTGGSSQSGDTALSANIKLDGDWTLIAIGEFPSVGEVIGINDGTLANFSALNNNGGVFTNTAGGIITGSVAPTQIADVNSGTLRLAIHSHGGANWTHPFADSVVPTELGGRNGVANINSEYSFLDIHGTRARGQARQGLTTFSAGARRITIGATSNHGVFSSFVLKTLIYLDHQISLAEQVALYTFATSRNVVLTGAKNYSTYAGSSVCGGAVGTPWNTLLQSVSPAPFAGTYAAATPVASWDNANDASDSSGSREGQFVTHLRGTTDRLRDLIGGAHNSSRGKEFFLWYEGYNDAILNSSLTTAQRAQIAIDSAIRAYQGARAAGYPFIICSTLANPFTWNGTNTDDPGSPFNIGLDPNTAQQGMGRLMIYNNWIRQNWQSYGDALWDPCGNIELRYNDTTIATTTWGGTYGSPATLMGATPHPSTAGNVEYCFNPANSPYTAAYAAAYTAAWPASPYPIVAINGGPFKVGLWHVLHSLGIV